MGNKVSQKKAIEKDTGFSEKQVKRVFRDFQSSWGVGDRISLDHFKKLYVQLYPHMGGSELASRVFEKFDADNQGNINFKEFVCALGVNTNGKIGAKLRWVFSMYDMEGSGYLHYDDVMMIVQSVVKMAGTTTDRDNIETRVRNIFKLHETNKTRKISEKEFVRAFKTEPGIRELFSNDKLRSSISRDQGSRKFRRSWIRRSKRSSHA